MAGPPASALRRLLTRPLPESRVLLRASRWLLDRQRGDNNDDMASNGELRLMRARLPGARVIFDVGANRGDWTERALEINPGAEYHLFEPTSAGCALLHARGFPPSVKVFQHAVGGSPGSAEMFIIAPGASGNSLHDRWQGVEDRPGRERVTVITLDEHCRAHGVAGIDFLKLDVEGHELEVLRGAATLLREGRIRSVQFEYGGTYLDARIQLRDVLELVWAANPAYRLYKLLPGRLLRVESYQQSLETFQYSNWLFELPAPPE